MSGIIDELNSVGFTEYELRVIRWIQEILAKDPTTDNRTLLAVTRKENGSVPMVTKLRGKAREAMGIERRANGAGVLDVKKFVEASGAVWTEERSVEIRSIGGWKLVNDPFAPAEEPKVERERPQGRRKKRSVAAVIAEVEAAGSSAAFNNAVIEMRRVMRLLGLQAVTVDVGTVVVSSKVNVVQVQDDGTPDGTAGSTDV